MKKPIVAILGSTGNLGSRVFSRHLSQTFSLVPVSRNFQQGNYFYLSETGELVHPRGVTPDLIINLANYYTPNENNLEIARMEKAITEVARSISKCIQATGVGVISASTYFQYAPEALRPWSKYAELKRQAQEILLSSSEKKNSNFIDFVLYDNFGGIQRGKFIDLVISALKNKEILRMTPGEQLLNLTHLDEIADAILTQTENLLSSYLTKQSVYELKSQNTRTLKDLVNDINSKTSYELRVEWGALPYRAKEVFESWETGLEEPTWWSPKTEFLDWLQNLNLHQQSKGISPHA